MSTSRSKSKENRDDFLNRLCQKIERKPPLSREEVLKY